MQRIKQTPPRGILDYENDFDTNPSLEKAEFILKLIHEKLNGFFLQPTHDENYLNQLRLLFHKIQNYLKTNELKSDVFNLTKQDFYICLEWLKLKYTLESTERYFFSLLNNLSRDTIHNDIKSIKTAFMNQIRGILKRYEDD